MRSRRSSSSTSRISVSLDMKTYGRRVKSARNIVSGLGDCKCGKHNQESLLTPINCKESGGRLHCRSREARVFVMLKPIVLAAFIFGLCSPSFAASPALFGDLFGDDSSFATINTTGHHARPHSASATNRAGGRLSIAIDITTQQMIVADGDDTIFSFVVSTGRKVHATPTGHFRPVQM